MMELCFGILWGIITLSVLILTKKFYIPYLVAKNEGNKVSSEKTESNLQGISKVAFIVIAVICSLVSAVSGYRFAGGISVGVVSGLIIFTFANGILSCIFVTDMQLKIIPNACVIAALGAKIISFVTDFILYRDRFRDSIVFSFIVGAVAFLFLFIMSKITRDGIGMGDVKLLSAIGFLCGLKTLFFTILLAFVFASVFSLVLIIMKKKSIRDSIPFGPMFWVGFQIAVLLLFV